MSKMLKMTYIDPTKIVVGERFRKDYGDVEEMAESILHRGLINPVTLGPDNKLVAGGRRLQGFLKAVEKHPRNAHVANGIPVIIRSDADDLEMDEVELLENIHRKDLTWAEECLEIAHIHKKMEAKHGKKDWSKTRTALFIGVGRMTASNALEMAEALEIAPELAKAPTADAGRRMWKRLIENAAVQEALNRGLDEDGNELVDDGEDGADASTKPAGPTYRPINSAPRHYNIGDALEGMAERVKRKAPAAHFAEVDPPYGIALLDKKAETDNTSGYNEIDANDYPAFLRKTAKLVYDCLYKDSFCVWWFGPDPWQPLVKEILEEVGFKVDGIPAIWYKPDSGAQSNAPDVNLARQYESFFVARKGKPVMVKRGRSNVFAFQALPPTKKIHPTERPPELIKEILETFAFPEARVLCPFLGSGATLMACYQAGMIGYGWDMSEEYKRRFLARVQALIPGEKLLS